jgi:four helix bundle protein
MDLVRSTYIVTASWPADERFGLTSQIRRAAISVPSNIAEGSGRSGTRELRHGLSLAHGSLCELETQMRLAIDLGFCGASQGESVLELAAEVGRVTRGLIRKLDGRNAEKT